MHEKTIYNQAIKMFAQLVYEYLRNDISSTEEVSKSSYASDLAWRVDKIAKILTMEEQERK